jgi:hypothetical protein
MAAPAIQNRTSQKAQPLASVVSGATDFKSDGLPFFWWKSIADAALQNAGELFKLQQPAVSAPSSQSSGDDEPDIEPPTSLDRLLHACPYRKPKPVGQRQRIG